LLTGVSFSSFESVSPDPPLPSFGLFLFFLFFTSGCDAVAPIAVSMFLMEAFAPSDIGSNAGWGALPARAKKTTAGLLTLASQYW